MAHNHTIKNNTKYNNKININPDINDPYYRYKMPAIECRCEGHGGNRNTKLLNLDKIAASIARPSEQIAQWFKIQFTSAVTKIPNGQHNIYQLKGHLDNNKLQNALFNLIRDWVLCPTCKNPETYLLRSSAGTRIKILCHACGKTNRIKQQTYHGNPQYFSYLINTCGESSANSISSNSDYPDNDDFTNTDSIFIPKQHIPVTLSKNDEDWSIDTSPEAVAARQAAISSNIKLANVIEPTSGNRITQTTTQKLCTLLEYTRSHWPITIKEFRVKYILLELEEKKTVMILPYLWRGDNINADLTKYMKLMEHLLVNKPNNQYYFLRELSRYLEVVLEESPSITSDNACGLLMRLYEEDLIDDISFTKWYTHGIGKNTKSAEFAKRLKSYLEPFNQWMLQPEEDENICESNENTYTTNKIEIVEETGDDNSDLDIDAI